MKHDIDISFDFYLQIDVYKERLPERIDYNESLLNLDDYKVPIGLNRKREVVYLDFTGSFSHLIVAGISGAGKSILVHSILTSLSIKNNPPDLYLCDLKFGVELQDFEYLEHTKGFVTSLKDLEMMIDLVIFEMSERYKIMKKKRIKEWKGKPIVLLIDEMVDLKIESGDTKEIAFLKSRIKSKHAQITAKGRAARVYSVNATQRPDKDVINGIIKTNVANTVAFKTRDAVQSRVIMDNALSSELDYIPGRAYFQQSEDVVIQTYYLSAEKEAELLKNVSKRVIQREQTGYENRKMDQNIIELEQVGFFDDDTGSKIIQFARAKY